jgi:uncharacterized protein
MIDRPGGAGSIQHRVFLDANVLFSAAYRDGAGLVRLWSLPPRVVLISSPYAIEEARRNLEGDGRARLEVLLSALEIVGDVAIGTLPIAVELPEKDRPILVAAITAAATHLLTGDRAHFGALYGRRIGGVLVQRPADYLHAPA